MGVIPLDNEENALSSFDEHQIFVLSPRRGAFSGNSGRDYSSPDYEGGEGSGSNQGQSEGEGSARSEGPDTTPAGANSHLYGAQRRSDS